MNKPKLDPLGNAFSDFLTGQGHKVVDVEAVEDISQCPTCLTMTKTVKGSCGKCGEDKIPKAETPMGVSAWREHGKRFGYWDFFVKDLLARLPEMIDVDGEHSKIKCNDSNAWNKCLAEVRKRLEKDNAK